jgi:hypothetical protein
VEVSRLQHADPPYDARAVRDGGRQIETSTSKTESIVIGLALIGILVALTFWWDWQDRHKDDDKP